KEELKQRLRDWGTAMARFDRKEEEIRKLQEIHEIQKRIQERYPTEKIEKEFLLLEKEYREDVGRLRIEMVEILREKARIDEWIQELTDDEAQFVKLRFEKGYGFDYISGKMHLSRATVFRLQDRVLQKMEKERCFESVSIR
ncbi:MAG: hypothetical protein IJN89_01335, partial [Anaerotignum sp.]|nr:hypothetical protein [Anaerotignum sp.]